MKRLILFFFIVIGTTILTTYIVINNDEKINSLKFSNTQEWGAEHLQTLSNPVLLVPDALDKIQIKEPPQNTSKQTKQEIKFLKSLVTERSLEKEQEIENEIELSNFTFNELTLEEVVKDRPHTNKLLGASLSEISTILFHFKNEFDRVRPSFLETSLTTSISVPEHPAYPSGHATQAYFIALILSDINPKNKESYEQDAYKISHNREIAGLHYPTDSEAGKEIASKYFELLSETGWYKLQVWLAKGEWEK